MSFVSDLRPLVRHAGYPRLLATRLLSQASDGIFQMALAGAVIFSPEKAPDARSIAAAFATVLLPFSCLGPFVGVFLDRWQRRRILWTGNALRAVLSLLIALAARTGELGAPFFLLVLVAFSVNRFVMSALSAALPHVVPRELLVTANALTPTCGTIAYVAGMGLGTLVRTQSSDLVVLSLAAVGFGAAGLVASRLPFLGPPPTGHRMSWHGALREVVRELNDALRHAGPRTRLALLTVATTRIPFGVMTTAMILLARHTGGTGEGHAAKSLAGLGVSAGAAGVGLGLAMLLTPTLVARLSIASTIVLMLAASAVLIVFPSALFTPWAIAVGALGIGWTTQSVKICIDSLIQTLTDDHYLGRVFSFYDVIFNAGLVVGVTIAAYSLPVDGKSVPVMLAACVWYALSAVVFTLRWRATAPAGDESLAAGDATLDR